MEKKEDFKLMFIDNSKINVGMLVHRGLREVLGSLAEIGYDAEWQDIRAEDMGAPHKRERIWIVAYPESTGRETRNPDKVGNGKQGALYASCSGCMANTDSTRPPGNGRTNATVKNCNGTENGISQQDCESNGEVPDASRKLSHGGREERRRRGEFTDGCEIPNTNSTRLQTERTEQQTTGTTGSNTQREIPNTTGNGLHTQQPKGRLQKKRQSLNREFVGINYDKNKTGYTWPAEPAVGGCFDGLLSELDKNSLTYLLSNIIMNYVKLNYGDINAQATKKRISEILSALRHQIESEDFQWETGRFKCLREKEILLSILCEFEKKSEMQINVQHESKEIFERHLRELRLEFILTGPPCRPGLHEQCRTEYTNSLQALSRFLAYHCQKAWERNCWENAYHNYGWERNIDRLVSKLPRRVDRLKGLGNAIVPQIAEILFRQIKDLYVIERKYERRKNIFLL